MKPLSIKPKNLQRVLKYLIVNGPARSMPFHGTSAVTVLLTSEAGAAAKLVTDKAVLDHLFRADLVQNCGGRLSISQSGVSWIRREEAKAGGEEGQEDANVFAAQHRRCTSSTINMDGNLQAVCRNDWESPLARLRSRKDRNGQAWLDEPSFLAGERLRMHFTQGGLMQKVTSSWELSSGKASGQFGKVDITDQAIDARAKVEAALDHVGPDLAGVLTDVCFFLKGLETVERERRWPPRSAKLMLRTGLKMLARYYGTGAGDGRRRQRTRIWHDGNERPQVSA